MNHNLETVPRLYRQARPGADYANSLKLLKDFKQRFPHVPTKSGLMVGLGETDDEIVAVMRDLRAHDVDMLTIGQYLQPSPHHLPVTRYVEPAVFEEFARQARALGFVHAACGPLVRSSYHADQQAHEAGRSLMAPADGATSRNRVVPREGSEMRTSPCLLEFPVNRQCSGSGHCRSQQRRCRQRTEAGAERRLDRRSRQARRGERLLRQSQGQDPAAALAAARRRSACARSACGARRTSWC